MAVFVPLSFAFKEILTSSKLNQMDQNIDEVRRSHKANTSPPSPVAGVDWIDDSSSPWIWKKFDGTQWVTVGFIDSTNHYFVGNGPSIIVSPVSLVGAGTTKDFQQSAINGLKAWQIWFDGVGGNNSGGHTYIQIYNNETLISSSNYGNGRIVEGTANGDSGITSWQVDSNNAGSVTGYINIWTQSDDTLFIDWKFRRGANLITGVGEYSAAVTDVDGFRIGRSAGSFDSGTVAIYRIPAYKHT